MNKKDKAFYWLYREDLRRAIRELAKSPYASASISAGGGSKSYTFKDLGSLREELARVEDIIRRAVTAQGHGIVATYPTFTT